MLEQFLLESKNLLDYQDALDYVQFRYSAQLRDVLVERASALSLDEDEDDNSRVNDNTDQPSKRHSRFGRFERIRASQVYKLVRSFGMTSEQFGENLDARQRIYFAEDPAKSPGDLAEELIILEAEDIFSDHKQALEAAQAMYVEEIYMDPRIRKFVRAEFERKALVDVVLTERGRKRIDESSPFFDFKYACNLAFNELRMKPELFLRMLLAEGQGLIDIRFTYPDYKKRFVLDNLLPMFGSDGVSDIANAWNKFRATVLNFAMKKTVPLICRNIKENLKKDCELSLMLSIRKNLLKRLNQAPYKPNDYELGTIPRVLSISAGMGDFSKDAILAVYIDEDSRIIDRAKLGDPRSEDFKNEFVELVTRRKPDVIGLSGFSVSSEKLYGILKNIIEENHLKSSDEETTDNQQQPDIELIWVQDEVARLYQNSKRAELEFPDSPPLERYLISLARYVQSPLLEYAALGSEISGIPIHAYQHLLPEDLFKTAADSCFVDMVNLVGVDINDAVRDTYISNLLQYISGLGPRKASSMLQGIQSHGGSLSNRTELVTEGITGRNIFINCASFLKIPYDKHTLNKEDTEMLDATRIHPEDYELARKMAGDALELDEEDLVDIENTGGVISHLINEGPEKLNDLILSGYAEELERKLNQKKYITLEMIKEELQNHYNEQRHEILKLTDMEIFTMLTGETNTSLHVGSVIPVNIKRIADRYISVKLSSGLNGNVKADRMSDKNNIPHPSTIFHFGQTVRAVVLSIDYKNFTCELSTREREVEEAVKNEARNRIQIDSRNWNHEAEDSDKQRIAIKRDKEQRSSRVIKHPLFRMFNSKQAEEFLAPLSRGDLVIRPSSRGFDHIAITWKVADQIFQHIDVLELEKPNEYSLGKFLQIGNKRYSDLDELIVLHIKSMARKVDEMTSNDKFRKGGKTEAEEYLRVYLLANPKRSAYTFCFDHKNPGYFYLCFQVNGASSVQYWHVKVIPNGYYLLKSEFPDVTSLCNGFKTIYQAKMAEQKSGFGGGHQQSHNQGQQPPYNNEGFNNNGFYGQQPPQGPQAHYQQPRYGNHDSSHGGNNGGYYNGGNGGHNNDGHRYR
ncbi:hypothetical protein NADFUDRAFT_83784 [Nadsonia fulvescens var. elongata DSM 6958]|uniref:Transcription elongation factor SPT6 n=1 Tax=Nadsonia fulvescens var. elongata DSM 6958 TaxID=857566 RepID=A0A1E3PFS8_9ASCO|nr:hypothetical protein NADFUDRAFT_83784 [Nadsonia fulvescens var. elongata DSM 6958]